GKLENVKLLSEHGVRAMTLTWNGQNEIGSGVCVENPRGITSFGRGVIHEMEKYKIAVDVSHASEKLFYDVADIAKRPFIATHSNSRAICPHKRNLTDEQFEIISKSGGIVGLVFARDFLTDNVEAKMKDIIRHAEHFLSIGGENSICLGSDFDGTDIPKDMTGIESLETLYELFLRENYNESLLNKIFFENALNFYQNFDKSLNLG
ncbi:MAG: membrane dipeptidase, partial [Bacillota bacterium]|nr:membrane dipeptidase [Bacillota bacterium]